MPGKTLFFRLFAYNTVLFGDIIYFNPVILQEKGKTPESTIMNSDEWGNAMTSSTRELPSLSLALMPVVLTLVVLGVKLFYFEDFTPHVHLAIGLAIPGLVGIKLSSEERRVGNECVSPCRSRGLPHHKKK